MKATIDGIELEGTAEEFAYLLRAKVPTAKEEVITKPKRKRGRPKGSKNRAKWVTWKRWSKAEDNRLKAMYKAGWTYQEITKAIEARSFEAIKQRAKSLGICNRRA